MGEFKERSIPIAEDAIDIDAFADWSPGDADFLAMQLNEARRLAKDISQRLIFFHCLHKEYDKTLSIDDIEQLLVTAAELERVLE